VDDTSATAPNEADAIPLEPVCFRQHTAAGSAHFDFQAECLDYKGPEWSFRIAYDEIGSEFAYREQMEEDLRSCATAAIVGLLICFGLVKHDPNSILGNNHFTASQAAIRFLKDSLALLGPPLAITYLCGRFTRAKYTSIPTSTGVISVYDDGQRNAILREIKTRRIGRLKRLAVVDRPNEPASELRKFRWLKEEGIITEKEFSKLTQEIELHQRGAASDHLPN
jgi:hypothetical protein